HDNAGGGALQTLGSVAALDVVQSLVFFFFLRTNLPRIGIHLFILAVCNVISIYELLSLDERNRYLKRIFRLNALFFG
ncbi:MAG: hypothetical protein P8017_07385, partial [Deltaproteobacteria bacterium]